MSPTRTFFNRLASNFEIRKKKDLSESLRRRLLLLQRPFPPLRDAHGGESNSKRSRARNLSPRIGTNRGAFRLFLFLFLLLSLTFRSLSSTKKKSQPQPQQHQQQPLLLSAADVAEAPVAALARAPARSVVQLYRSSASSVANAAKAAALTERARREVSASVASVEVETCFNVGLGEAAPLGKERAATLAWLLAETFEPEALSPVSSFGASGR